MKRTAIYARVSTRNGHQDPKTQLLALRQVAARAGWQVMEEYIDHGISGAKGRDQHPAFDQLLKDATRRRFDITACRLMGMLPFSKGAIHFSVRAWASPLIRSRTTLAWYKAEIPSV